MAQSSDDKSLKNTLDKAMDAKLSRRTFIKGAVIAAGVAAVPGVLFSSSAQAAGKLPKAAVQYQDHPKGNKECKDCIQFIPGAKKGDMGTCKVVQGKIHPDGYCIAFVAKS